MSEAYSTSIVHPLVLFLYWTPNGPSIALFPKAEWNAHCFPPTPSPFNSAFESGLVPLTCAFASAVAPITIINIAIPKTIDGITSLTTTIYGVIVASMNLN